MFNTQFCIDYVFASLRIQSINIQYNTVLVFVSVGLMKDFIDELNF